MKKVLAAFLLIFTLFLVVSCDKSAKINIPADKTGKVNDTFVLTPEILNYANEYILVWESSDPAVVKVEDGTVYLLKVGTATITVSIKDTEISGSCVITVTGVLASPQNLKITGKVLSWDAVTDATGYVVQVGTSTFNTTTTSYDFSSLNLGDSTFKVKATTNKAGLSESEYSAEIQYFLDPLIKTNEYAATILKNIGDESWTLEMTEEDFTDATEFYRYSALRESAKHMASAFVESGSTEKTVEKTSLIFALGIELDSSANINPVDVNVKLGKIFGNADDTAAVINFFINYALESADEEIKASVEELLKSVTYEDITVVATALERVYSIFNALITDFYLVYKDEEITGYDEADVNTYLSMLGSFVDAVLNNYFTAIELNNIDRVFKTVSAAAFTAFENQLPADISVFMQTLEVTKPSYYFTSLKIILKYLKTVDAEQMNRVFADYDDQPLLVFGLINTAIDFVDFSLKDADYLAMIAESAMTDDELTAFLQSYIAIYINLIKQNTNVQLGTLSAETYAKIIALKAINADGAKSILDMIVADNEALYQALVKIYKADKIDVTELVDLLLDYPNAIISQAASADIDLVVEAVAAVIEDLLSNSEVVESSSVSEIIIVLLTNANLVKEAVSFVLDIAKEYSAVYTTPENKAIYAAFINSVANNEYTGEVNKEVLDFVSLVASSYEALLTDANIQKIQSIFDKVIAALPAEAAMSFPTEEIAKLKQLFASIKSIDLATITKEESQLVTQVLYFTISGNLFLSRGGAIQPDIPTEMYQYTEFLWFRATEYKDNNLESLGMSFEQFISNFMYYSFEGPVFYDQVNRTVFFDADEIIISYDGVEFNVLDSSSVISFDEFEQLLK